jgi:hypothetical protein
VVWCALLITLPDSSGLWTPESPLVGSAVDCVGSTAHSFAIAMYTRLLPLPTQCFEYVLRGRRRQVSNCTEHPHL